MPQDKAAGMAEIAAQVRVCPLCRLATTRNKAVPGTGSIDTEIVFIGEAPGQTEDKTGHPFVGRSGDYLNKMLQTIGLSREAVFITNVVKCRPPENRDPLPDEITICKPYIDNQIELIDPLVICTLGRFSMARYFPDAKITKIHGQPKIEERRAYLPLFHPAAVLRNPGLDAAMREDFAKLQGLVETMRERRGKAAPPTAASGDDGTPPTQMSLF